jgi:hypothetical protein
VTKVHRVISFKVKDFLAPYVKLNNDLRADAHARGDKFGAKRYKMMNNALFGKTIENMRDRTRVDPCRDVATAKRAVHSANFQMPHIIDEDLVLIEKKGTKPVCLEKPIHIGFAILELSKLHMYRFHYDVIRKQYGNRCKLLYTDTDSLLYHIYTETFYEDIKANVEHFDTSVFVPENKFGMPAVNCMVPGKFKIEYGGIPIHEYVGLACKMYSVKYGDKCKKIAKGTSAAFKDHSMTHEDYLAALHDERTVSEASYYAIRAKDRVVSTRKITQKCLSNFETKRYILDDGISSLAYGHHLI